MDTCKNCDASCKTCTGPYNIQCSSCSTTFLYNNQCYTVCPKGVFGDSTDQTCKTCHPSCKTCSGPNINQCVLCPSYSFFSNNECVDNCPSTFYNVLNLDNSCTTCQNTCSPCYTGCTTCTSKLKLF